MKKSDLSKKVYEAHGGISYADAQKIVDSILEIIKSQLLSGEKVLISGFGCFSVMMRKDKKGVDPQTGNPIVIRGRKAIKFKPSNDLKLICSQRESECVKLP